MSLCFLENPQVKQEEDIQQFLKERCERLEKERRERLGMRFAKVEKENREIFEREECERLKKEEEWKEQLRERFAKVEREECERLKEEEEYERLAKEKRTVQNSARKQQNLELLNQQKAAYGATGATGATLIDKYKEDYDLALKSINNDVKTLINDGHDMMGLMLLQVNVEKMWEIHDALEIFYKVIYLCQPALTHFKSKRFGLLNHDLIRLSSQQKDIGGSRSSTLYDLNELGYAQEHPFLDEYLISETEYLLEVLPLLIEPDFIPFEQNTDDDTTDPKTDRYISKSVKISVWRRDSGKCVECGSQEKLEYDHIIPVTKGGSNTDRNVQLLCEKCNRQKSANIQ